MAIQYAASRVNTSFTGVSTRAGIVTALEPILNSAGWTTLSGTGTSDVVLQSAATAQNLQCRVRIYDAGSGNCARFKFQNADGSKLDAADMYLIPNVAWTYRVLANPYQFFVLAEGQAAVSRSYVAGGVPYLPADLVGVITECVWANGNASADIATGVGTSFRNSLLCNADRYLAIINGYVHYGSTGGVGNLVFVLPALALVQSGYAHGIKWHDGSYHLCEPLLSFGLSAVTDEGRVRGQLWDAMLITSELPMDTTYPDTGTIDGHTWWNVTSNNTGGSSAMRGSLLICAG